MHETQPVTGDDEPPEELECDEWINNFECTEEWNCYEVPDDEPMDPCVYYGVGCDEGGEEGGGGNPSEPPPVPEIINNVNDPCIKNSVNDAISRDCKNEITSFVNTVFANSDQFHLQFNDGTFAGADADDEARTSTGPMPNLTETMTTIRFNNGQLGSASKEYIAATVLHEVVHAWIDYKFPLPVDNAHQHSLMAGTNRFNLMRSALLEMYPNMDPQDATDLTWGGLYSTIEFSNLPPSERDRIIQKNRDYKNHTKGTPC